MFHVEQLTFMHSIRSVEAGDGILNTILNPKGGKK